MNTAVTDICGDGIDCWPERSDEIREVASMSTSGAGSVITKEILARRWFIGMDTMHRTLKVTTQAGIRKFLHPMECCVKTQQCTQVFTDGQGWDQFYPQHKKNEAGYSLNRLIDETGVIPCNIVTDDAMEETGGTWKAVVNEHHIVQKWTEPYSPWQNKAEASIHELKKFIKCVMVQTGVPK